MKKIFLTALLATTMAHNAFAQKISYVEEMQYLGSVAGQGLACNAEKYDTYELLARAILISKAKSDQQQEAGMRAYNEQKAGSFIYTIGNSLPDCADINESFNKQKIFKSTLYGDGTIKMFDGKIITPRHPYDATLVYKKDPDAREKYMEIYRKGQEKVQKDPVYQRALREQQLKHGF